jgi:hypothetical protein
MMRNDYWSHDDEIFLKKNYKKFSYKKLGRILNRSELSIGHKINYMGLEKGHLYYKLRQKNKRLTKELAYILGATMGDGSVSCKDRTYTRILFSVKDKEFAVRYKNFFDKQFGINSSFHKIYTKWGEMYRVRIGYKKICEFIKHFDTNLILNSSDKIKKYFLMGIYDAEGHVSLNHINSISGIGFTNTNKKIIKMVSNLLNYFDIEYGIYNKTRMKDWKECKVIKINNRDNFIKFREKVGFHIKRKHDRLFNLPKLRNDLNWKNKLSQRAIMRNRDNYGRFLKWETHWKEVFDESLLQKSLEGEG